MRNPLRMPKGVPREIVRALRLGSKRAGQFLDFRSAFLLRDALRTYYAPVPKRKPRVTTPKPRPRKPLAPPPPPEDFDDFEDEEEPEFVEGVLEYEVGIDYHASAGRTSNVSFNARFYRADNGLMTEDDAREVLRHMVYHGEAPAGIVVQEVYWQRQRGGRKRYGRPGDMTSFFDILGTVGDNGMTTTPMRLGAVKRDRL